jgi:hypothetical protein
MDEQEAIDAMAEGLERHGRLLRAVLPYLASEGIVVAAAAEGILSRWADARVQYEKRKRDLVVERRGRPLWFEFKTVWPGAARRPPTCGES